MIGLRHRTRSRWCFFVGGQYTRINVTDHRPALGAALGAILAACAPSDGARNPTSASTKPNTASPDAVAVNARCASCHQEIAREWRESMHGRAFEDPSFQQAFALEPLPFCHNCHAPEATPQRPEPALAALGIPCTTCHSIDAAESGRHASDRPAATKACANCHEFFFPGTSVKMQFTATEHRNSPFASRPCTSCHMPRSTHGGSNHRFAASRDPQMLRSAAKIVGSRDGDDLVITFTRNAIGHAFPTGDLFRRLRVEARDAQGNATSAMLGRKTKLGPGADNRPFVNGDRAVVRLPVGSDEASFQVFYERVQHPLSEDGRIANVTESIELARGAIERSPRATPVVR